MEGWSVRKVGGGLERTKLPVPTEVMERQGRACGAVQTLKEPSS